MTEAEWLSCASPAPMLAFLRGRVSERMLRLFAVACCRKIWGIYRGKLSCRAVVLAERLADGMPVAENLPAFRSDLHHEGFREIDGYRQEKEAHVQFQLSVAAYHALADGGSNAARPQASLADWLERLVTGTASVSQLLAEGGGEPPPFSIESWIPPDLSQAWQAAAWAVAHWRRRGDRAEVRRDDFRAEAREQVPLAHDIFGNPFRAALFSPEWRTDTAVALARQMYESRDFSAMPILADALQDAGCDCEDVLNHCRSGGVHVRGCWAVDLVLGRE